MENEVFFGHFQIAQSKKKAPRDIKRCSKRSKIVSKNHVSNTVHTLESKKQTYEKRNVLFSGKLVDLREETQIGRAVMKTIKTKISLDKLT